VTNVGSALTTKILESNGQTVCRLTLWHLTDKETHCPIHLETCRVFDETIASHLGPNATDQDFPAEDLIPDFDHYNDDHDLDPDHGDLFCPARGNSDEGLCHFPCHRPCYLVGYFSDHR
jgi:hypothetical protein